MTKAQTLKIGILGAGIDALIVPVPLNRVPDIKPLLADLPERPVIIDTSNYYPALDNGQVESRWAEEQLGRPVVKAWNAITAQSFTAYAGPSGTAGPHRDPRRRGR